MRPVDMGYVLLCLAIGMMTGLSVARACYLDALKQGSPGIWLVGFAGHTMGLATASAVVYYGMLARPSPAAAVAIAAFAVLFPYTSDLEYQITRRKDT